MATAVEAEVELTIMAPSRVVPGAAGVVRIPGFLMLLGKVVTTGMDLVAPQGEVVAMVVGIEKGPPAGWTMMAVLVGLGAT